MGKSPKNPKEQTDFGARLQAARLAAGFHNRGDLAELSGVRLSTLAEAELSGKGSTHTAQLARALKVHALWLATGEGPREISETQPILAPQPDEVGRDSISATITDLARLLVGLTPVGRRTVARLLSDLAADPGEADEVAQTIQAIVARAETKTAEPAPDKYQDVPCQDNNTSEHTITGTTTDYQDVSLELFGQPINRPKKGAR